MYHVHDIEIEKMSFNLCRKTQGVLIDHVPYPNQCIVQPVCKVNVTLRVTSNIANYYCDHPKLTMYP